MSRTMRAVSWELLLLISLLAAGTLGRSLLAADAGPRPKECSGRFTEEWKPTKIECHVCPEKAQLKCEVKGNNVRDAYTQCEYDMGALSRGIDFQCTVEDNGSRCNWSRLKSILPPDSDNCAYYATYSILQDWVPSLD
ncbi:hypothetical protein ACKKBF_B19885 [Auxenochlorella protothecoides x Auxenochlorella symbiontica]